MFLTMALWACAPDATDSGKTTETGEPDTQVESCDADGDGYCPEDGDCNDGDAAVNPGATEVCDPDNVDEDCSGDADDNDPDTVDKPDAWLDADADGYGDDRYAQHYCDLPTGWAAQAGDCDDADANVHPGAAELCDEADQDEDCDGLVDDADEGATGGTTWYLDADGDGAGDATLTTTACDLPTGYAVAGDDCDDTSATTAPGADEVCDDGVDNDCNGRIDACDAGVTVDLATAGARITGDDASDGISGIFPVGDLDGDGYADLALGGTGIDHTGASAGAVSLSYGPYDGQTAFSGGDVLAYGAAASDRFGAACAGGELTGDGVGDLVCTAPATNKGAGGAYVFAGPLAAELSTATATTSFAVSTPGSGVGSLLLVGDFSGDGVDDLVTGGATVQTTWRVDGPLTAASYDDTTYAASWREGGIARSPLATVGADLDGDGILDLAFGDDAESGNLGAVWIAYGGGTGDVTLSDNSDASILGTSAGGKLGGALSAGGDADGDGYIDLAVGQAASDAGHADAGAVLLFNGPFGSDIDETAATVELYAGPTGSSVGSALLWGADLDADGLADLAIGQPGDSAVGAGAGSVAIAYGPLDWSGSLEVADLIYLGGAAGDAAGSALGAVDLVGDGVDRLIVASPGAEAGAITDAGAIDLLL